MRITAYSFFIILLNITLSKAQAPVISATHVFEPETEIINYMNMDADLDPGTPGENKVWNYNSFVPNQTDTSWLVNPNQSPNSAKYPESTVAITFSSSINPPTYYEVTNDELFQLSNSLNHTHINQNEIWNYTFSSALTPALKVMQFPTTYNTTWTSTSVFKDSAAAASPTLDYDSMKVLLIRHDTAVADAYGELILPDDYFPQALRIFYTGTMTWEFYYKRENTWTKDQEKLTYRKEYDFWVPGKVYPVLQLRSRGVWSSTDGEVKNIHFPQYYKSGGITTNLKWENKHKNSVAYPNPTSKDFFVLSCEKVISLTDCMGREVDYEEELQNKKIKIKMSHPTPGMYIAKIKENNLVKVISIQVVK